MPDDKAQANALIDKYDGYFSSLDVNGLCHELSTIVMQWTYTVYEVFNVMSDRRYSQAALEQVATNLTDRINDANLIELAKTMHGATLMARLQYLMNCQANPNQSICQRLSTAFKRASDVLREQDKKKPNKTGQPRQLTPDEIAFFIERGQNQKLWIKNGRTVSRKLFDPAICWDLPESGAGFTTYKIDDLRRKALGDSKYGYDQIGTKETIEAVIRVAAEWSSLPANNERRLLQIGDISRPGGINTPDHSGHVDGKNVDIRPIRNDAQVGDYANVENSNSPFYHRDFTKEFIRLVKRLYPNIFIRFNDGEIAGKGEFTYVHKDVSGTVHDNHLHLEFR